MLKKVCFYFLSLLSPICLTAQVQLAVDSKALAEIVLPAEAPTLLKYAAEELQKYLQQLSGAEFPIVEKNNGALAIYLGEAAALQAGLSLDGLPEDGFIISVSPKAIHIAGKDNPSQRALSFFHLFYDEDKRGTLLGVYQFLEKFGALWVSPQYSHLPRQAVLQLPEGLERIEPSFAHRRGLTGWDFMRVFPDAKEYCQDVNDIYKWGLRLRYSNRNMVDGCHSENSLKLKTVWQEFPERFMMNPDGSRNFNYLCWTDPAVTEFWKRAADSFFSGLPPEAAGLQGLSPYLNSQWPYPFFHENEFMIDPHDHDGVTDGRCRCPRCNAFREKYPCPDDSEIVWKVIVEVAEMVKKKFPGKYISTLVYPPKMERPKLVKIPDNVRVRICISGPKEIPTPKRLESDLALIRNWSSMVGSENLPLWAYQCIIHGRRLPGPPETHPHLTRDFLQKIKPLTAGMYLEMHSLSFTYHSLDTYILGRLMWDIELDLELELQRYFQAYYGPAAQPAQELFCRFEDNWVKLWRLAFPDLPRDNPSSLGMGGDKKQFQQETWRQVYDQKEMQVIDQQIAVMEKLCAGQEVFAKHVRLLRQYIFQIMQAERSEVMEKEERRSKIRLEVKNVFASEDFTNAALWQNVASQSLISASRLRPELQAGASFKMLRSGEKLLLQADFQEAKLDKSKTIRGREMGDRNIWQDNDAELFIYSVEQQTFWQFIVNDEGKWAAQCLDSKPGKWRQYPGAKLTSQEIPGGWRLQAEIPLAGFGSGEWRFNLTRSRQVEGAPNEFSTWSKLAMLGNWHEPDNYGVLIFVE